MRNSVASFCSFLLLLFFFGGGIVCLLFRVLRGEKGGGILFGVILLPKNVRIGNKEDVRALNNFDQ